MTAPKKIRTLRQETIAKIVAMIRQSPTSSREITDACGIYPHEIARELRYYVENDKIRLQNVTGPHGRKMKAWVWTESRPRAVEKKHKCLACQTNPVPGGREWVCPRCKNTEVWKGSSPYAIA